MTETEKRLLDSAIRTFARYGVRKTTMGDIASEAGVSRQTLYASFKNKDVVLGESIRHVSRQQIDGIRAEWEGVETFQEKLEIFFQRAAVAAYDLVSQSPDAQDMQDGYNDEGRAAIKETRQWKAKLIAEVLIPHAPVLEQRGQTPDGFADYIVASALNFKHTAGDRNEMIQLLASLKAAVQATITTTPIPAARD